VHQACREGVTTLEDLGSHPTACSTLPRNAPVSSRTPCQSTRPRTLTSPWGPS
jgi:hypothetical protein